MYGFICMYLFIEFVIKINLIGYVITKCSSLVSMIDGPVCKARFKHFKCSRRTFK